MVEQAVYVSATPGPYEMRASRPEVVEQVIRPTGLVDPAISVRPTKGQIDDLLDEINARVARGERVSDDDADQTDGRGPGRLSQGNRVSAPITCTAKSTPSSGSKFCVICAWASTTLSLASTCCARAWTCPKFPLVAILGCGQGRLFALSGLADPDDWAAPRDMSTVRSIMYADTMTRSMKAAIDETYRRRADSGRAYNEEHSITPRGIVKQVRDPTERVKAAAEERAGYDPGGPSTRESGLSLRCRATR